MIPPVVSHSGEHEPPSVRIDSACPHAFLIGPLGRPTRWFRERGYTLPILSGERNFDARWAVEADDHEFAEALVRLRETRAAIAGLAELGCVALKHCRRRLTATLSSQPEDSAERERHEQAVREKLTALDTVIARLCRTRSFPHNGGRVRLAVMAVMLGLTLIAGLVSLAVGSDELLDGELGSLVLWSLLVSVPLTLLLIGGTLRLLAGRSTSHKDLGVVVLLLVFAFPTFSMGAAVTINRALDDGPPTVHRLPVLELGERHGDGDHVDHFAIVPGWRETGGSTERLHIGRKLAAKAVAGKSWLRLTTSPGRLDAERQLDLQLEDDGAVR